MPPAALQVGIRKPEAHYKVCPTRGQGTHAEERFSLSPEGKSYPHDIKAETPRHHAAPSENHAADAHTSPDQDPRTGALLNVEPPTERHPPSNADQPMPADDCVTHTFPIAPETLEVVPRIAKNCTPASATVRNGPPPAPPPAATDDWDIFQ